MANEQQKGGDTSKRGFASMDEDKQRDIARKGGESVPDEKRSFSQDPELASEAGKKAAATSKTTLSVLQRRGARAGRRAAGEIAANASRTSIGASDRRFGLL